MDDAAKKNGPLMENSPDHISEVSSPNFVINTNIDPIDPVKLSPHIDQLSTVDQMSKSSSIPNRSTHETLSKSCQTKVKKTILRQDLSVKISPKKSKLLYEIKSTSPKQRTKNGSISPNSVAKNRSPVPEYGSENKSPKNKTDNGSLVPSKRSDSRIVDAKSLHPEMVSSPSLKPVRINRLIEKFENNIVNANEDKRVKLKDAFEVLMVSGVGDTPKKTPKRKLKRISKPKSTKNEGQIMEKWLKKMTDK